MISFMRSFVPRDFGVEGTAAAAVACSPGERVF
jgi:hypothetical protein